MSTMHRLRLVALVVLVDAVMLVAAYSLSRSGGGAWFAAFVFVLIAVLATTFVAVGLSPGRRPVVALPKRGGIGVSNSPVIAGLLVALLVAFLVLPVSLAVAWVTSGERPVTAAGPLVLLVISVAGVVPVLVGLLRGRYRLGGLVLTPDEVAYESFLRRHSLPWDQVRNVVLETSVVRLEQLNVQVGLLRTDARALHALLDFYRTHPRARHEIADGTALARKHELA